jgi:hypothetical protein
VRVNPFFELYVGDRLSSSEFVTIFSPFLVRHAEALFLPGNVVVKGVQGSGKSMLLSLLKPEVRLEYARARADFPVKGPLSQFIGAGINLAHSNGIDFGYRAISQDPNETAIFFGDFVNCVVLLDLFRSISTLSTKSEAGIENLAITWTEDRQEALVSSMTKDDGFQGIMSQCKTIADVEQTLRRRLNAYRRFLHMNDHELDAEIRETKMDIGLPLSAVASLLKLNGIIDQSVSIFIHIDQYEELANISPKENHSPDYRRVINRALARRDPSISYRIGTRGHAWRDHGYIFGAEAKLEEERDYKFVDLDLMLRRNENRKTWIFPSFVEDVFTRRLRHVGIAAEGSQGRQLLESVFGNGMSPADKARKYGGRNPARSVKVDSDWPENFRSELIHLATDDPLSARLLEAWILQRIGSASASRRTEVIASLDISMLAAMQAKVWWNKERIELALIQIAGRCQQRPLWSGYSEIVDLSGGNILTFLSICQHIWDTQNQVSHENRRADLQEIETEVQAVGIFKASEYWLKKIGQETGRSGDRMRLVRQIGLALARELYADRQMSYPGHNGFSIADEDLERFPHVKQLLDEMSDYGTIASWPHTTKEKDRRSRQKFFLNPVLCPQFKIHHKRQKEPRYIHPSQVEEWMNEAGLPLPDGWRRRPAASSEDQPSLFDTRT